MTRIRGRRQPWRKKNEAILGDPIGAREREPGNTGEAHARPEVGEVLANRQRGRREHPGLVVVIDERIQLRGYIERREVQAQAPRIDFEPAKPVPGVVTDQYAETFAQANQLLMQFLEFDRRVTHIRDGHLDIVQRMRKLIERAPDIADNFSKLVSPFLARRVGTQGANGRLQLVHATIQLRLCIRQRGDSQFVEYTIDFAAAERHAKKLHGQVRKLMGLIDNHRLGTGQELDKALLFHGQVSE